MLNLDTINKEIKKLEECDYPTWNVCEKLATLYIIKDHFHPQEKRTEGNIEKSSSQLTPNKL